MTNTDPTLQEAEALLALEAQATPGPWGLANTSSGGKLITRGTPEDPRRTYQASVQIIPSEDADLVVALRNRAPAVIRVLMEQVDFLTECNKYERAEWQALCECQEKLMRSEARLASLEAERELEYDRAQDYFEGTGPLRRFTPTEIATRVEAKRKERTP